MENVESRVAQILSRFSYSCSLNIIQPMREYGVFTLYGVVVVCGVHIFLKAIFYVLDDYGREIGTWNINSYKHSFIFVYENSKLRL